jgi:hypothetical protein
MQKDGKENQLQVSHTVQRIDLASFSSLRLLTTVLLFLIAIIYPYLPLQQVLHSKMIVLGGSVCGV